MSVAIQTEEELRLHIILRKETEASQRLTNTLRVTTEALQEVTAERDALTRDIDQWRVDFHEVQLENAALKADAERYRKAAQMAVEMIETNAHERRHVRWALIEAMKGTS